MSNISGANGLREMAAGGDGYFAQCDIIKILRAADEIDRLRTALSKIAVRMELNGDELQRIAFAALSDKGAADAP